MNRQNQRSSRQLSQTLRSFVFTLLCIACVHQPVLAQDIRVERLQQTTVGGFTQSDEITLFSSAGAVTPSGTWQNDTFEITSGSRSLLSTIVALIRLAHVPSGPVQRGSSLTISGSVQGPNLVQSATLLYRRGGADDYTSLVMSESGGQLQAQVPAQEVTSEGIAYHMELVNHQGQTVRSPALGDYGVSVRIQAPGLVSPNAFPGGTEQSAYRLVSVPLSLEAPDPEEVFVDDFGPYDPADWRMFALTENQSTREFSAIEAVELGESYWLITRERQDGFDTGPGITAHPADEYAVAVHPGWNLVGNPFHFDLPVSSLSLGSGEALELRSFNGSWSDPINETVDVLDPFTGYALFNPSETADTLSFNPMPQGTAGGAGKRVASSGKANELNWSIRILARSGVALDADNIAGVAPAASEGPDQFDHPEPPVLGSFVSLYFAHPEWGRVTPSYSTDIRSAGTEGLRWDFDVRSGTGEVIHLNFEGIESVPPQFRIWLVDELTGVVTDLRDSRSYSLSDPGSDGTRALQMIVGTNNYASAVLDELDLIPDVVELEPVFPNPVRRSMTIQYGLPKASNVTLRLYNATGQLVQEIVRESKAEGRHSVVWEPSSVPTSLANGVYILELRAGGDRRSQMVTLLQ